MGTGPDALPERIHLVGIGGMGLSAIARVLAAWGHRVSGSDLAATPLTAALAREGLRVYAGHDAAQVGDAEMVVISSAIPDDNPEVRAARDRGIPVLKRQQLLGRMMAGRRGVAVAGTHGKTTTTAMIATMMERLGLDPTYIVGGLIAGTGSNARVGAGPHFLIEADEYDRMFLGLRPEIGVVTSIEMDHPDCYPTLDALGEAFEQFLRQVPLSGCVVACADSPVLMRVLAEHPPRVRAVRTYGSEAGAEYRLARAEPDGHGGTRYRVTHGGAVWAEGRLAIPGRHNALNATAALLCADWLGLELPAAAEALARYAGTARRFEVLGTAAGVEVIDDYAHHPTKIRATLAAARERYPGRRLWAVWQPHTYSRTRALLDEFGRSFAEADRVLVLDVYPARASEQPSVGMGEVMAALRHPSVRHTPTIDDAVACLLAEVTGGDVVITLSAGDGNAVGRRLLASLAKGPQADTVGAR